jgi:N-acetylmuramoyl-L-alanine amidase
MANRVAESNAWGADLHVPIHTNAHNAKTTGTRIFCWDKTGAGYKASKAVFDVLAPLTPGASENVTVNKALYEIKKPKASSVYVEVDFHDVNSVAKWLINNTKIIGETIAKGICNYYGVKFVEEPKPAEVIYRVQIGAYKNKAEADALAAALKGAFVVEA